MILNWVADSAIPHANLPIMSISVGKGNLTPATNSKNRFSPRLPK